MKDLPSDVMADSYIGALLWSETTEDGTPLDRDYTAGDIDKASYALLWGDAHTFMLACGDLIKDDNMLGNHRLYSAYDMAGHDLALTKNGHGTGFWDGGWKEDVGKILTYAAKAQGERHLYVGDDGMIHAQ